jgi:hypothetical protein
LNIYCDVPLGPLLTSLSSSLPRLEELYLSWESGRALQPGELDSLAACGQLRSLQVVVPVDVEPFDEDETFAFPPLALALTSLGLYIADVTQLPPSLRRLELEDCTLSSESLGFGEQSGYGFMCGGGKGTSCLLQPWVPSCSFALQSPTWRP